MFLGYISSKAVEHELSSFDSYLGGSPKPFSSTSTLEPNPINCTICHERMNFLMQIYCPLDSSPNHRALHFFVCLRSSCQLDGSNWRVLRSQVALECLPDQVVQNTDWDLDQDSDDESSWGGMDEEAPKVEEIHTMGTQPTIHSDSNMTGPFEPYHIDVYEDEDSNNSNSNDSGETISPSSAFESWCQAEAIEQEFIDEDDNTNSGTFTGALANYLATRNEYGCESIRYSWSGRPIFDSAIPKQLANCLTCHRCQAPRVFEVQLFATINNSLKLRSAILQTRDSNFPDQFVNLPELDKLNPDWLLNMTTVLVFSCSKSCSPPADGWIEECLVVQTDSNVTKIVEPKI